MGKCYILNFGIYKNNTLSSNSKQSFNADYDMRRFINKR